ARDQYRLGAVSLIELLNAETTYEQARIALVQAQAARYADTAALFEALGGGWWHRSDVAQTQTQE
ncbi:MAG: TolC family protein, partial [Alphaproteobacteria bacterium]|nr:TolC family protein [Alphaproteobacteria bacterium]